MPLSSLCALLSVSHRLFQWLRSRSAPPSRNGAAKQSVCSASPLPCSRPVPAVWTAPRVSAEATIRCSKLGFLVFATVRTESDLQLLKSHSLPNVVAIQLDVASADSRQSAASTVASHLSQSGHRLHSIVLNAGWALSSPLELVALDTVRSEYEANVYSIIHLTQLFLPLLRQARFPPHTSRVVITSSSLGSATIAGGAVYSSTKHAVEALGDGFRMELTPWAIDVVLVEPGSHATPFHPKADARQEESLKRARVEAVGRCGEEVMARYEKAGKEGYSPPPSEAKQPIGVVIDAIVTGLLAKYAPARIKCGMDSAMGGVLGLFPAFVNDKVMGKGYV